SEAEQRGQRREDGDGAAGEDVGGERAPLAPLDERAPLGDDDRDARRANAAQVAGAEARDRRLARRQFALAAAAGHHHRRAVLAVLAAPALVAAAVGGQLGLIDRQLDGALHALHAQRRLSIHHFTRNVICTAPTLSAASTARTASE